MLSHLIRSYARVRDALLVRWRRVAGPFVLRAAGVELGGAITLFGWPVVQRAHGSTIRPERGAVL